MVQRSDILSYVEVWVGRGGYYGQAAPKIRYQPHWTCMTGYDMPRSYMCMYGACVSSYACAVWCWRRAVNL